MNLKNIFLQPHPFVFNWKSIVIPFVITVFILIVFKPFEFNDYSSIHLIIWSFVFGIIASVSVLVTVVLLKKLFPKMMEERNWKVWKEMVLILLVVLNITILISILFWLQIPAMDPFEVIYEVSIRTFSISIIPVLVLVLFEQYHYKKVKYFELEDINEKLKLKQGSVKSTKSVQLEAENKKIVLKIDPVKVIYLKSEGNYVEVFYLKDTVVVKELIRNRLKAIEKELPGELFVRCHKSYIVNLQYIEKAAGDMRNLRLSLRGIVEKVPVSRNTSKDLLYTLKNYHPTSLN